MDLELTCGAVYPLGKGHARASCHAQTAFASATATPKTTSCDKDHAVVKWNKRAEMDHRKRAAGAEMDLGPDGVEGAKAEQLVGGCDHSRQASVVQPVLLCHSRASTVSSRHCQSVAPTYAQDGDNTSSSLLKQQDLLAQSKA
eukprot:3855816-Rhodomonas_salina.2